MSDNNDYKDNEVINVMLPRKDYKLLQTILQEREAKNWLTAKVSSWWIFGLATGALVIWKAWNEFSSVFNGTVK